MTTEHIQLTPEQLAAWEKDKNLDPRLQSLVRLQMLGVWEHWKGNEYEVYDLTRHHDTGQFWVSYRPRGSSPELVAYNRLLTEFIEPVQGPDGQMVPRFRRRS